jgi:AraC-like DNA-binding protein
MRTTIDTGAVPRAERADRLRDLVWRSIVRVELDHPPAAEISVRGAVTDLGRVSLASIRANPITVRRTSSLAGDDLEPSIFVSLQLSGSSLVIQGDREAVLRPGDLAIYDATIPYTLVNDDGLHLRYFRVPISELALPRAAISQVSALRLGPDRSLADLTSAYLRRLAGPELEEMAGAEGLSQPSIGLIRALITTQLPEPGMAREPLEGTLQFRIMEYVRAHLAEPDLSAVRIAAEHHISVRHLYATLARSDIVLGEWIRRQRLEECRKELATPGAARISVAAVGRRWGFGDATNFGRAFSRAYGMPPREWRNRHVPNAGRP